MKHGREQEPDTHLVDAATYLVRVQFKVDAQCLQQISAATSARDGTVAVLGNGQASPRRDEGHRGRDVEGPASIAARAAGVHQDIAVDLHRNGVLPHRLGAADDLLDPLPLHPERGEEGPDLRLGGLSLHYLVHDLPGLGHTEVASGYHLAQRFPDHCGLLPLCSALSARSGRCSSSATSTALSSALSLLRVS